MAEEGWQLYYWPLAGRGEFVRLLFEESGVPYTEFNENIREKVIQGEIGGYPAYAPPLIKKGNFQLSNTPVICKYLGKKFGLYPDNEEDEWHAEQVNSIIHDYLGEGCLSFHGINAMATHKSQKEETQPYIKRFVTERLPRWLKYFESVLKENNGGQGFVVGNKLTYVDLGLFHILRTTESQFPEAWQENSGNIPLLIAFKKRIETRPKLVAYLKSDRWRGFEGNSMM